MSLVYLVKFYVLLMSWITDWCEVTEEEEEEQVDKEL